MRVVVQRSKNAAVRVDGQVVGEIDKGMVLLVGITHDDNEADVEWMAAKLAGLRFFDDAEGRMNLSIAEAEGEVLSISQFTLYADCRKGRRPNYMAAARPEQAERLYAGFNERLQGHGLTVATGVFGAMMDVNLVNWGPVTLILDSQDR
ncbi:D-aminoacyl-tRNA deacylase [Paenibacillus daejeonensis]|uniref:D-aminoacyl-tRNA deacylase n=1 Tax=Paenibacillus daejeonensis TaxID=135193 RepID=UPI0003800661|nr:D-aminoacyl-tRNA deacylase [Paenibacillus daejeonensis]